MPVSSQADNWTNVTNAVQVQSCFSPHPVETNIYYFRYQEGSESKVFGHLADIVSRSVLGRMKNPEAKYHISENFFDKILQSYLEPSDVKKIDAGGGMIHGEVVDFAEDTSGKLILAHSKFIGAFSSSRTSRWN